MAVGPKTTWAIIQSRRKQYVTIVIIEHNSTDIRNNTNNYRNITNLDENNNFRLGFGDLGSEDGGGL